MRNSEIFYFDVDGTLLNNHDHSITQKTIDALKKLKEKGYKLALCTGRTLAGIKEAEVDQLVDWDGFVLANGSVVLDKEFNTLHNAPFSDAFIKKMLKLSKGPLMLEGDYNFYTDTPHQPIKDALAHFKISETYPVMDFTGQAIYNVKCYEKFDEATIKDLEKDAQVLYDQMNNYEIIPKSSGKDKGIEVLNQHLKIKRHTVFGDGDNDVTMIQKADIGVAMGNGTDKVKTYADFVTKSVSEDGIVHALKIHNVL